LPFEWHDKGDFKMTKSSKTLINETIVRRWGKLANMPALTENFLDTLAEEEE